LRIASFSASSTAATSRVGAVDDQLDALAGERVVDLLDRLVEASRPSRRAFSA
jgi:hypothetical protein